MNTMRAAIALLVLLAAARCTLAGELQQPAYTVLEDLGNDVEHRRYNPARWVVTDVDETSLEKAQIIGFNRLFKYISGNNELERKIEMTKPVVTTIHLDGEGDFRNFTIAFFLPDEFQPPAQHNTTAMRALDMGRPRPRRDDVQPPAPRDELVRIVDIGETEVYELPFGLYALGYRVKRLASDFFDWLERGGHKDFGLDSYQVAVYDPPTAVPWDRHNEIWAIKQCV